ncbi:MAG: hypothetical protein ABIF82_01190 [Planctomycetota bacterium]
MKARTLVIVLLGVLLAGPSALAAGSRAWYNGRELDKAKNEAKLLGKPMVIMYQETGSGCPKHNAQRAKWRKLSTLRQFVCIELDMSEEKAFINSVRSKSGGKEGRYIPMLFLTTPDGKFLEAIPDNASSTALNSLVRAAQKKFGPVLPRAKAIWLWKQLASARKLWKEQKHTNALACYRTVALAKNVNPNLPIVAELKTDEEAINEHGAKPLKEAETLRGNAEVANAESLLRKIIATYEGFDPAVKAQELLDQIHGKDKKQPQPPGE